MTRIRNYSEDRNRLQHTAVQSMVRFVYVFIVFMFVFGFFLPVSDSPIYFENCCFRLCDWYWCYCYWYRMMFSTQSMSIDCNSSRISDLIFACASRRIWKITIIIHEIWLWGWWWWRWSFFNSQFQWICGHYFHNFIVSAGCVRGKRSRSSSINNYMGQLSGCETSSLIKKIKNCMAFIEYKICNNHVASVRLAQFIRQFKIISFLNRV